MSATAPAHAAPPPTAPHLRIARSNAAPLVVASGAATTLLALAAVWALSTFAGENVMGWYADYVLPAGALLVGVVASSGFGVASWVTGTKITGKLLVAVGLSLFAGYWGAKYLEFRVAFPDGASFADGTPAGFFDWYDFVTRSFAWNEHGKLGKPLGALGYALRVGEIVGFSAGGLVAPFLMRRMPYCTSCGVYMRQTVVAVVPAGVVPKRIKRKDRAAATAQEAEARTAYARGAAGVERIVAAARAGDAAAFGAAVAEVGPLSARRATEKLSTRLHVRVVQCRRCAAGALHVQQLTGQGQQLRSQLLAEHPLERGVAPRLAGRG